MSDLASCDPARIAEEILAHAQRSGQRPIIGIDGPGGSGKSTFAELLAAHLPDVAVVHVDDFYLPSAQRPQRQDGIADNFDLDRLAEQVLRPAAQGTATRYQRYDWDTDSLAEWIDVPARGPLIVEGVYCLQETLRAFYTYRVFCATDRAVRLSRGIERDGEQSRALWVDEWMPAEDRYLDKEDPASAADLVVDGSNTSNAPTPVFLVLRR